VASLATANLDCGQTLQLAAASYLAAGGRWLFVSAAAGLWLVAAGLKPHRNVAKAVAKYQLAISCQLGWPIGISQWPGISSQNGENTAGCLAINMAFNMANMYQRQLASSVASEISSAMWHQQWRLSQPTRNLCGQLMYLY